MEFIKLVISRSSGYDYHDASNIAMNIIGNYLSRDVRCHYVASYRSWALNPSQLGTGGNLTDLFKEDDNIIMMDLYSQEKVPTEVSMTQEQFVRLLNDWEEKVCKASPKEVVIKYENDQYNIETGEGVFNDYIISEEYREQPDFIDNDEEDSESASDYLKFDYENILGFQLLGKEKLKVRGFFHDYLNSGEKQGIMTLVNKVVGSEGCYAADFFLTNGHVIPHKTFYPAYWSREKVMRAIVEAFDQCKVSGLLPIIEKSGKYKVKGITSEGVEIEMFITCDGTMIVAYPKVGA